MRKSLCAAITAVIPAASIAITLMAVPAAATPASAILYHQPSVAWTGRAVVVVAIDASGDIDYFRQRAGTSRWHEQLVASGDYEGAVIASTGKSVVIAALAVSTGAVDYWWQATGSSTWHPEVVATSGFDSPSFEGLCGCDPAPSIAWTGTAVILAAAATDGHLYYWWQQADTTAWNEEQPPSVGACCANKQPSMAWTGSRVVISTNDGDGFLSYWWQKADTTAWHEEFPSGSLVASSNAIASTGKSVSIASIAVYTKSGIHQLALLQQQDHRTKWSNKKVDRTISLDYQPAAIGWTGSSVVLTAIGFNGSLYFWQQDRGETWTREHVAIGVRRNGDPGPAIAAAGHLVVIVTVGRSGRLDYWWHKDGTTTWHKEHP
jgi:hypothetical protein